MKDSTIRAVGLSVAVALLCGSPRVVANPADDASRLQSAAAVDRLGGYDFELVIVRGVDGASEQTITRRKMNYREYEREYGPFTPDPRRDFDPIEEVVPTPDPPVGGTGFEDGDTLTMTRTGNDGVRHYTRTTRYERLAGDWLRMTNDVIARSCNPQLCLIIHKP